MIYRIFIFFIIFSFSFFKNSYSINNSENNSDFKPEEFNCENLVFNLQDFEISLLSEIFSFLSGKDLIIIYQLNHKFKKIVKEEINLGLEIDLTGIKNISLEQFTILFGENGIFEKVK